MKTFTKHFLIVCFILFANNGYSTESFRSNLYLLFPNSSPVLADGNLVQYNNNYNAGIDFLDAVKLTNINETFGLMRDGVLLSIERRPVIALTDTLFFDLTRTTQRNYQFQLAATLLNHPGLYGNLQDAYTGISTPLDLNGTTTIDFTIDSNRLSQAPSRFMVVFSSSSITPVTFTGISVEQQVGNAEISWAVENEVNIKQYEVERSVNGNDFISIGYIKSMDVIGTASNKYLWEDVTIAGSNYFYRICSVGINGELAYSKIVKLKSGNSLQNVNVYPNPATGSVLNLQMANVPSGLYQIRLLNSFGQVLQTNMIVHYLTNTKETIPINKNFIKGVYQLELNAASIDRITTSFIYNK